MNKWHIFKVFEEWYAYKLAGVFVIEYWADSFEGMVKLLNL